MEYCNSVSVIIPVYNEELFIEKCLNSIIEQDYQHITEILVIDGMSNDKTREIVKGYMGKNIKIKLIDNLKKFQSEALNIGIKVAVGEIVVRVDAHAVYDSKYVSTSVKYLNDLRDQNVVNVGGPTYLMSSENYIENCIIYLHESKFGIGVAKFRQKDYEGYVDTVWNGAFWRWVFDEVGLYNVELTRSEDNDMNNRITEKGYKIYQSKNIIAYYKPRSTVSKLLKQNYSNGIAIGESIINNPGIIRIRHLVPLIFTLGLIIFSLGSIFSVISRGILLLELGSYFLVDILESLRIGMKHGVKYIPALIFQFFILHVFYGLGTIAGILKGKSK